jgi:hypothetical protein
LLVRVLSIACRRCELLQNVGIALELITPLVPGQLSFLVLASLANAAKAVAGLATGATRATFLRSFALQDNLAEVTAKAQGQGIGSYLAGMAIGVALASAFSAFPTLPYWVMYIPAWLVLAAAQIYAGYRSLLALAIPTFNLQRLEIAVEKHLETGYAPDPEQVRSMERFVRKPQTRIVLGASVRQAFGPTAAGLLEASRLFRLHKKAYVLHWNPVEEKMYVLLERRAAYSELLEAVYHAKWLERLYKKGESEARRAHLLEVSFAPAETAFAAFQADLPRLGWIASDILEADAGSARLDFSACPPPSSAPVFTSAFASSPSTSPSGSPSSSSSSPSPPPPSS